VFNFFFRSATLRNSIPQELSSEASILAYLEVSTDELKKIWWFRSKMYNVFSIPKGNGKLRTIYAPDDRLKHLQSKLALLLNQLYRVRNPVHGFVEKKSVKTNATAHLNRKYVLNIDLQDFFPSITEKRIVGVLKSVGINSRVSEIVARICCYEHYLPQGSPASPILSNMICFRLDKELLAFSKKSRCIYTRYADDITFSSYQPMSGLFEGSPPAAGHLTLDILSAELQRIFQANGFTINPNKVHYADSHSRRMVTGLKINELINVDRRYVRNIRATLHSINRLGIDAAQSRFEKEYGGRSGIGDYLLGKITWLRYIRGQSDPVFRALAVRYNDAFPARPIKVAPDKTQIRDRAVWVVEHLDDDKMDQGSAFFLADIGLVTAYHCVANAKDIDIYHPSKPSNKFKASMKKFDKHRDLAILEHNIPPTEFFELKPLSQTISTGDRLIAVGYPDFGHGDKLNVREGTVSSCPVKSLVQYIEVTQKLSQGMSGGPLITDDLEVAGVIHKGGPGESRDFAIHIKVLDEWLAEEAKAS
jgi:RNA-directed DNA polymerase